MRSPFIFLKLHDIHKSEILVDVERIILMKEILENRSASDNNITERTFIVLEEDNTVAVIESMETIETLLKQITNINQNRLETRGI